MSDYVTIPKSFYSMLVRAYVDYDKIIRDILHRNLNVDIYINTDDYDSVYNYGLNCAPNHPIDLFDMRNTIVEYQPDD